MIIARVRFNMGQVHFTNTYTQGLTTGTGVIVMLP